MQIAVISDSHDNIWKLERAIPHLENADVVLHCGDLISPFMIKKLADGLPGKPIHFVWGNNDGDRRLLAALADQSGHIKAHGEFASLELDGHRIWINHYPEVARAIAESGKYDLVCYGHDHTAYEERIGNTLLLNPGEIMGLNGQSTLAILTDRMQKVLWIEID